MLFSSCYCQSIGAVLLGNCNQPGAMAQVQGIEDLMRLQVCALREGLRLKLAPAQSDVISIVPIHKHG